MIKEASSSQVALFKCVKNLFKHPNTSQLPSYESAEEFCNRMAEFFASKIKTIHANISSSQEESDFELDPDIEFSGKYTLN